VQQSLGLKKPNRVKILFLALLKLRKSFCEGHAARTSPFGMTDEMGIGKSPLSADRELKKRVLRVIEWVIFPLFGKEG